MVPPAIAAIIPILLHPISYKSTTLPYPTASSFSHTSDIKGHQRAWRSLKVGAETMKNLAVYHMRLLLIFLFINLLICLVSRAPTVIASGGSEDLASQFLVPQNQARAQVGDPPLVWDENVASYAQEYANKRRGDCALKHSNGPFGENIFWGSGSDWQPKDATAAWIGEDRFFNYHTHSCNGYEDCGHYTQIVWKHSRTVGCARVICNDGDTFMTCNYNPPGNYIGQNPY